MDANVGSFANMPAEVWEACFHPVHKSASCACAAQAKADSASGESMIDRWRNRRKMAWACMLGGLFFPLLVLLTESDQLGAIAASFYVFVGAVVGAYIGFATVDDRWQKDKIE